MKKTIISLSAILAIIIYLSFIWTPLIHFRYKVLREIGLREKAQVQYNDDGSISVDKLDPGEEVELSMVIGWKSTTFDLSFLENFDDWHLKLNKIKDTGADTCKYRDNDCWNKCVKENKLRSECVEQCPEYKHKLHFFINGFEKEIVGDTLESVIVPALVYYKENEENILEYRRLTEELNEVKLKLND